MRIARRVVAAILHVLFAQIAGIAGFLDTRQSVAGGKRSRCRAIRDVTDTRHNQSLTQITGHRFESWTAAGKSFEFFNVRPP